MAKVPGVPDVHKIFDEPEDSFSPSHLLPYCIFINILRNLILLTNFFSLSRESHTYFGFPTI